MAPPEGRMSRRSCALRFLYVKLSFFFSLHSAHGPRAAWRGMGRVRSGRYSHLGWYAVWAGKRGVRHTGLALPVLRDRKADALDVRQVARREVQVVDEVRDNGQWGSACRRHCALCRQLDARELLRDVAHGTVTLSAEQELPLFRGLLNHPLVGEGSDRDGEVRLGEEENNYLSAHGN